MNERRAVVVIDSASVEVAVEMGCFALVTEAGSKRIHPRRVKAFIIQSNPRLSAAAIRLAAEHEVHVVFLNAIGEVESSLVSPFAKRIPTVRRAQSHFTESRNGRRWAKELLVQKAQRQARNMRSWFKENDPEWKQFELQWNRFEASLEGGEGANWRSVLMGAEGALSRVYWQATSVALPLPWRFDKRSRRPAQTAFNAVLNYSYGMLYHEVELAILSAGFDPSQAMLHVDRFARSTLAFDLIEPFRPLIDFACVKVLNEPDAPDPSDHVDALEGGGLALNRTGKAIWIPVIRSLLRSQVHAFGTVAHFRTHLARLVAAFESEAMKTYEQRHDVFRDL